MKFACVFAVTALLGAACCLAAEQSLIGIVSDSMCGAQHKMDAKQPAAKLSDAGCAQACVKHGAKYVVVSQGKVYRVKNQHFAGLEDHAAQSVRITGEMSGESIKITGISPHITEHKGEKSSL